MQKIIDQFSSIQLLVIGDLMLDEYIVGDAGRISPEAPVPIVSEKERRTLPGGAANVALNVHALGGKVCLAGVIGDDEAGGDLLRLLGGKGINASSFWGTSDRERGVRRMKKEIRSMFGSRLRSWR